MFDVRYENYLLMVDGLLCNSCVCISFSAAVVTNFPDLRH